MGSIIKTTVLGRDVEFFCESRDTRNGFAHDARLYIDGREESVGHCYYLNRTWEHWHYQSVCLAACQNRIDYRKIKLKETFKSERGLTRVAGKNKAELEEIIKNDEVIVLFSEIKQQLKDHTF